MKSTTAFKAVSNNQIIIFQVTPASELKLTVSSSFLFKVCISSTIRRTSPKIACSGIFLKAAFLSCAWTQRKSVLRKADLDETC